MTYNETLAIVYRLVSAYPFQTRQFTNTAIENMAREWHIGLEHIPVDGAMEAVTILCTEMKWMPSLSEIVSKIIDIQYGTDDEIIRKLDYIITFSSDCIIFGQVTDDQVKGYEKLSPFQKLIVRSPAEFNTWMMKDYEWKVEKVMRIKREMQYGRYQEHLNGAQNQIGNFDVFKALEERKRG